MSGDEMHLYASCAVAIFSEARALMASFVTGGEGRRGWDGCVCMHMYERGITLHCGTSLMGVLLRTCFQEVTMRAASYIIQAGRKYYT